MLFHNIVPSDVHPGDHLYRWRNGKVLPGIAVRLNEDTSEICVVTSNGLNNFNLVTLSEFKGRGILRRAIYDQNDSYLHSLKLPGTSFIEERRPVEEIVENALLLPKITNINPQGIQEILANNFAKLCCTLEHEDWRNKLLEYGANLPSTNNFEQVSHLISTTPIDEDKVKELEAKIETLEDKQSCSICLDRPSNVAFLCGHLACFQCAQPLKKCHICRVDIDQKIELFWC